MKKRTYAIEFAAMLLFFVLPPLLTQSVQETPRTATYPPATFLNAIFAALLLYAHRERAPVGTDTKKHAENAAATPLQRYSAALHTVMIAGAGIAAFGVLCCSAAVLALITRSHSPQLPAPLLPPHGGAGWLNCAVGTAAAVFYEEALYRRYLPEAATALFGGGKRHRHLLCEAFAVVSFAAGHRYLGIAGIVHALIAGIALRRCLIQAGSLLAPCAAHGAYNAALLAVNFLQAQATP